MQVALLSLALLAGSPDDLSLDLPTVDKTIAGVQAQIDAATKGATEEKQKLESELRDKSADFRARNEQYEREKANNEQAWRDHLRDCVHDGDGRTPTDDQYVYQQCVGVHQRLDVETQQLTARAESLERERQQLAAELQPQVDDFNSRRDRAQESVNQLQAYLGKLQQNRTALAAAESRYKRGLERCRAAGSTEAQWNCVRGLTDNPSMPEGAKGSPAALTNCEPCIQACPTVAGPFGSRDRDADCVRKCLLGCGE